jgi:hypothetical protein
MTNVFISYKRGKDRMSVRLLSVGLEQRKSRFGHGRVFFDRSQVRGAQMWPLELRQGLEKSEALIVAIGEGWIERAGELHNEDDWARREILTALRDQKVILPVLLEDVEMNQVPELPPELRPILDYQALRFRESEFESDTDEIVERLVQAPREYYSNRYWSTINGLRGVLNLAWRHTTQTTPQLQYLTNLADRLVPSYFVDDADFRERFSEIDITNIDPLEFEVETLETEYPLFEPPNYIALQAPGGFNVQIGVLESSAPTTLVLYEQFISSEEAHVVLIEYRYDDSFTPFDTIQRLMNVQLPFQSYRLPYRSVFNCRINLPSRNPKSIHQSFRPYGEKDSIDSAVLAKLFDIEWLGSQPLNRSELDELHSELRHLQPDFTIIHGMEIEQLETSRTHLLV